MKVWKSGGREGWIRALGRDWGREVMRDWGREGRRRGWMTIDQRNLF